MGAPVMWSIRRAFTAVLAGALVLAASACASQEVSLDGPSYAAISDLVQDPTVIVVTGTFGEHPERVSESELGATFEDQDEQGLDLDLWPFTVTDVLVGDARSLDTIQVTQIVLPAPATDRERGRSEDMQSEVAYTAEPGRTSVLFLRPYPNESAYAVLGLGVGSFGVAPDGSVTAPREAPTSLADEVRRLGTVSALGDAVRETSSRD